MKKPEGLSSLLNNSVAHLRVYRFQNNISSAGRKTLPTRQGSSLRRGDGTSVVHASKKSQLGRICRGLVVLALMPPPARPYSGAPVGRLGLLGGAQVVEMAAVGAAADGAVQAHGALARLFGLALARPHLQTWEERKRYIFVLNSWLLREKTHTITSFSFLGVRIAPPSIRHYWIWFITANCWPGGFTTACCFNSKFV